MVPSLTPYDLSFPQKEGPKCTPQVQLRDACLYLANMIQDIDKTFWHTSDIAFCEIIWPLLVLFLKTVDMTEARWDYISSKNGR